MSGVGSFGAGEGGAGHDPLDELEARPVQTPVKALYFDPYDRIYLRNPDLTMVEGSPVIHRAAHLMLPLGSIPAVATSGFDVEAVRRATPDARARVLEDAVRRMWKVLVDEGVLGIETIVMDPSDPWNGLWYADVIDLTTKTPARLGKKR
jgi:hypothetical protein